jgi:hypothetical protein
MNATETRTHVDRPRGMLSVRSHGPSAVGAPVPLGSRQRRHGGVAEHGSDRFRDRIQRPGRERRIGHAAGACVHSSIRWSSPWRAWGLEPACSQMDRRDVAQGGRREPGGSAPDALTAVGQMRPGSAPGAVAASELSAHRRKNMSRWPLCRAVRALPGARRSLCSLRDFSSNLMILIFIVRVRRLVRCTFPPAGGGGGRAGLTWATRKVASPSWSPLRRLPPPLARTSGERVHGSSGWVPVIGMVTRGGSQPSHLYTREAALAAEWRR